MEVKTTVLLPLDSIPQADAVLDFVKTLDASGQRSMLDFIQGAKFMQSLMTASGTTAQPDPPKA